MAEAPGSGKWRNGSEEERALFFGLRMQPTSQVLQADMAQGVDPLRGVIEAGNVVKVPAACCDKCIAALDGNFFQRLDAIRHEAGAEHIHALKPLAGHVLQRGDGGRGQPLGVAKARLEGDAVLIVRQAQLLCQQPCRGVALIGVRVAQLAGAFGRAVTRA